ncbi:MAG: hypothetical protein ACRERD_15115, partial [Candidatus Binatia bacterium]
MGDPNRPEVLSFGFSASLGDNQHVLTIDPNHAAVRRCDLLCVFAGAGFTPLFQLFLHFLRTHDFLHSMQIFLPVLHIDKR